ncbi:unnamed protein product [Orchesella dallaii]|uniref:F-box domain-containing protein n=1 Tax=Orchesella dallaii TaxID=48710 RepID=A0ABP1R5R5_9HEXA
MENLRPTEISDLPNEMLEEIFNFLQDPNDFLSVVGTCNRWNDIMSYRKTERLFGKVKWKYIFMLSNQKYFKKINNRSFGHVQTPVFIAQVLPILLKSDLLPLRTMLTLRQISKNWQQETGFQLEEDPSRLESKYDLEETEQVNRFITHASNLPQGGNPFIGKYLSISLADPGAYDSIHQLIQQHGTPLRSIKMFFFSRNQFASMLGYIPNLEKLSIVGLIDEWVIEDEADALPLPPLLRLNNLCISIFAVGGQVDADDRYLRLLSFLLTAYGEQLSTLKCPPQVLRVGRISNLLPNIRRLELFKELIFTDAYTQPDLQVLSQVEWRLQTLSISGCYLPLTVELMTALNNFCAKLEDLEISIQLEENFDTDSLVCFPCLKKLKLGITSELRTIPLAMKDRLMTLVGVAPNLEELDIKLRNGAMCDVVWSMEVMNNVADAFQKLKVFRFFSSI